MLYRFINDTESNLLIYPRVPFVLISITSTSYVLVCLLLDVVFDIILYLWLWLYFILKSDELLDKLLDDVCLSYLQYLTTFDLNVFVTN